YHDEFHGNIDDALKAYRNIAETSSGSEQIGAINRYSFASARKYRMTNGLKKEVDFLKSKNNKDDFEWIIFSQYEEDVNPQECYRRVLRNPQSPYGSYAQMKLKFYLSPYDQDDMSTWRDKAIESLQRFIAENPADLYVPHAKVRIAGCLTEEGRTQEAIAVYRELLQEWEKDPLICADCIVNLFWLKQIDNEEFAGKAVLMRQFYGVMGGGSSISKDPDIQALAQEIDAGVTRFVTPKEQTGENLPVFREGNLDECRMTEPFPAPPVTVTSADVALRDVLDGVGASKPKRDAVDARVIEDVRKGTGRLIDSQKDVGAWPEYQGGEAPPDADLDGMPDAWETARGLNPNDSSDSVGDLDGNGYTNVEDYINAL
ncbi:MAG: hypothetical protein QG656_1389, partial [Candidatus Hydrogenedentes bacterium]|nr:hypothetical protein [Candidatus Hydrogenedentota bacterium]